MSLTILKSGLLDTIQDMGRYGYGNWGINPGGAMDRYAAWVANLLVGNKPEEGLIEMHFPAAHIRFNKTALISITGADFTPTLNDIPINIWQPYIVSAGTMLQFREMTWGTKGYLAVHGGLAIEKWLKSYSTNSKAGAGGWKGRRLLADDTLSIVVSDFLEIANHETLKLPWRVNYAPVYEQPDRMLFIQGNEWDWLSDKGKMCFEEGIFLITSASDRMAYTLAGPCLPLQQQEELVSSGVSFGTIQLLPNGQSLVLMADHQTTGGYPRLGHIISTELPKLAQLKPRDNFQFCQVDIAVAEEILFSRQQELDQLQQSCMERLKSYLC